MATPSELLCWEYLPIPGRIVVCRRGGCGEPVAGEELCELHFKEALEARIGVATGRWTGPNSLPHAQRDIRFEARPLFDAVIARYGSLSASGYKDQLTNYRDKGFDWVRADAWACWLGMLPEEVWPDWHDKTKGIEEPVRVLRTRLGQKQDRRKKQ